MGERKLASGKALKAVSAACRDSVNAAVEAVDDSMQVRTPGGVFSVRWDQRGSATALGQLAFFAEYLEATGLFERWLKSCPLSYTSPNAPELVDVLGTWMLSILDGHCRYAHVGALRGDAVAPSILGMNRIIGDDSLRRALGAIAPAPQAKHSEMQRIAQEAQLARSTRWGCRTNSSTASRRRHCSRGSLIATRRSSRCMASKTGRSSATTHTSRVGQVIRFTLTGLAIFAWCWMPNWSPVIGTARCIPGRV